MRIIIIVIMAAILIACSKVNNVAPVKETCAKVYLLSYKYTVDTTAIRTDTLWKDNRICGRWLDTIKVTAARGDQWIIFCSPPIPSMPQFMIERLKYFIIP